MANPNDFQVGDTVSWKWGSGTGSGTITEKFTESVSRTIKGAEVVRDASDEEPAFLIEQEDGDEVLKSSTELS